MYIYGLCSKLMQLLWNLTFTTLIPEELGLYVKHKFKKKKVCVCVYYCLSF